MDCVAPNYHAQMHDVNNELFADKSKMNIVLEPRDKHIIVLMTTTKLYKHTKVARHYENNPNMQCLYKFCYEMN